MTSQDGDSTPISTTHAGGGDPRLIFSSGGKAGIDDVDGASDRPPDFLLLPGVTSIGSSPDADLCLAGLAEHHAEVRRDALDEYVFVALPPAQSTVNGAPVDETSLHTGDRLELGGWVMSYMREEFADHGRPFGGRQGGEGSGPPISA